MGKEDIKESSPDASTVEFSKFGLKHQAEEMPAEQGDITQDLTHEVNNDTDINSDINTDSR